MTSRVGNREGQEREKMRMQHSNHYRPLSATMIPLLLLCLVPLSVASSPPATDDNQGKWRALQDNGAPCIMVNAQIDLTLSYIKDDDSTVDGVELIVPANSKDDKSTCLDHTQVGDALVDSQVLQLDFPDNEGWSVQLFFTQDNEHLQVNSEHYALYQVIVNANYTSMNTTFPGANKIHSYNSVIDFNDPPEIANNENAKIGDSIYCPKSPQGYIINKDSHNGPSAYVRFSKLQMQAYMGGTDQFGTPYTCAEDQGEIDLVPVIVSAVLAAIVLLTLIAYFIYRSRLPTDILDMTQPEFEEEEDHQKEHNQLNHHDNYGYNEEDHRF